MSKQSVTLTELIGFQLKPQWAVIERSCPFSTDRYDICIFVGEWARPVAGGVVHVEFQIESVPLPPRLEMIAGQEVRFSALPNGVLDAELEYCEAHGAVLPAGVAGIWFGAYNNQTLEAVIETFFYDWAPPDQTISIPARLPVALRHDMDGWYKPYDARYLTQLRREHYGWR